MKNLLLATMATLLLAGCKKTCTDLGKYTNCDPWQDAITGTWHGQATCNGISTAKTDHITKGGDELTVIWSDGFAATLTAGNAFVIPAQTVVTNGQQIQYSGSGTYSETALNYTIYATTNGNTVVCTMAAGR